jgi:UDP-N-acetylmuramyl-tripeptide synthetase
VRFSQLIAGIPGRRSGATKRPGDASGRSQKADPEITRIVFDSRRVASGDLFVALVGVGEDGHHFVGDAIRRGAAALVLDERGAIPPEVNLPEHLPTLVTPNSRLTLAQLGDRFYQRPFAALTTIAVTGTNGKTTVTNLVESIFNAAGLACGVVGTIFFRLGMWEIHGHLTTPESIDLARLLRTYADRGADAVALEASSHGIEMHRLAAALLDVGVFTNLTHDHLDFHGDMEAYFQVKRRLFTEILPRSRRAGKRGVAVIDPDDDYGQRLLADAGEPLLTYGLSADADVTARDVALTPSGTRFQLCLPGSQPTAVTLTLAGRHNLLNALAAAAAAHAVGLEREAIAAGLSAAPVIPGRLEPVRRDDGEGPRVFVDYAHTPDALRHLLQAMAELEPAALWVVFGCGGDRDATKRPQMGRIASELADVTLVTSDNPRSEDPEAIIEAVLQGVRQTDATIVKPDSLAGRRRSADEGPGPHIAAACSDRAAAIELAVSCAPAGAVVVIAGKGHERTQEIAGRKRPFDDREVARRALDGWKEVA